MRRTLRFPLLLFVLLAWEGLAACNLANATAVASPTLNVTQALQTVAARLTQVVTQTPTRPPQATLTPSLALPTGTAIPETAAPSPEGATPSGTEAAQEPCDRAAPGDPIDVTVDDDTQMEPGQSFTKVWRLVNSGTCTWNRQYHAAWFFGEKLGDTLSVPFSGEVPPNDSIDISVDMIAPLTPGTYQSNWKLSNPSGELFGIGPNGDQPFWVKIIVVEAATPTAEPVIPTISIPTPTLTPTVALTSTVVLTPTATPAPMTSGSAILAPGSLLDLDMNLLVDGPDGDVLYQEDGDRIHWLVPQENALLGVFGDSQPDLSNCREAGMSSAPIALEGLSPGTYLCYQTGPEHLGWLRYDRINESGSILQIKLLTWGQG